MLFMLTAVVAGFLTTAALTPMAIEFLRNSGIVGIDQQKRQKPELPTSGGVAVVVGFLVAISVYIGLVTFVPLVQGTEPMDVGLELLLASLSATLVIGLIGLIDDIHVDHEGIEEKGNTQVRVGLAQQYKYFAPLIAALPLMAVKAGTSIMHLPFIGQFNVGILYPLVFIPIGITCVVNATNMLAGQNGLETAMGAIAFLGLGVFTYLQGAMEGAIISFGMAAALSAFYIFNAYPARILPGDSLTYAIGAAFASAVIIANVERFGIVIFLPWIAEAFLKLRSRFQASSLGVLQEDGTLKPQHDKVYSMTHVLMRFGVTEQQLVWYAAAGELILVLVALLLFT